MLILKSGFHFHTFDYGYDHQDDFNDNEAKRAKIGNYGDDYDDDDDCSDYDDNDKSRYDDAGGLQVYLHGLNICGI